MLQSTSRYIYKVNDYGNRIQDTAIYLTEIFQGNYYFSQFYIFNWTNPLYTLVTYSYKSYIYIFPKIMVNWTMTTVLLVESFHLHDDYLISYYSTMV